MGLKEDLENLLNEFIRKHKEGDYLDPQGPMVVPKNWKPFWLGERLMEEEEEEEEEEEVPEEESE